MDGPRAVRHDELVDAGQTSGMTRLTAFEEPGVWVGVARTAPGSISGWHHHGDNETYIYCTSGAIRIESGPGGRDTIEAGPGDFLMIPANSVHRETNPTESEAVVIVTRIGTGPVLTNVDGADPA